MKILHDIHMRRSLYTYPRAAREPSPFLAAAPLLAPFSIPESSQEREELQVGEMDLLERDIKKGDTEEEEKARKEEERKEEEEVGERKTKTQEPQQGQGLILSLANGSGSRYLAS
jgi:jasmonate ZIM domain-containing protein